MKRYQSGVVAVTFERQGSIQTVELQPIKSGKRFLIGIGPATNLTIEEYTERYRIDRDYGFIDSMEHGWNKMVYMTVFTAGMLKKIVTGEVSFKSVGGVISIFQGAGQSAKAGLSTFLYFLGMLSVNLGFINLLPIPVLDGGHLMMNAAEAIKGQPLSEAFRAWASWFGAALVLGIMTLAIFNDIARFL